MIKLILVALMTVGFGSAYGSFKLHPTPDAEFVKAAMPFTSVGRVLPTDPDDPERTPLPVYPWTGVLLDTTNIAPELNGRIVLTQLRAPMNSESPLFFAMDGEAPISVVSYVYPDVVQYLEAARIERQPRQVDFVILLLKDQSSGVPVKMSEKADYLTGAGNHVTACGYGPICRAGLPNIIVAPEKRAFHSVVTPPPADAEGREMYLSLFGSPCAYRGHRRELQALFNGIQPYIYFDDEGNVVGVNAYSTGIPKEDAPHHGGHDPNLLMPLPIQEGQTQASAELYQGYLDEVPVVDADTVLNVELPTALPYGYPHVIQDVAIFFPYYRDWIHQALQMLLKGL